DPRLRGARVRCAARIRALAGCGRAVPGRRLPCGRDADGDGGCPAVHHAKRRGCAPAGAARSRHDPRASYLRSPRRRAHRHHRRVGPRGQRPRPTDGGGGMRLTFFGSSIVSAYWNGAATYYRGLLRALARHGHEDVFCESDAFDRHAHRDLDEDPEYARVLVYATAAERDDLVEEALEESDWVIKCSGVGLWDRELETAVAG